ncbi:hypothetical protein BG005_007413 [Podila minutissima]|nr:hypothetical protein BG005_007413 [Podila minutissima]
MTAIAQGHNGVSNGNGHHADGEAQQHSVVASTAFSHLTLYTGNTMRTGTTGQLNTTLRKSNLELVSAVQDTLQYSLEAARFKGSSITITDETSLGPLEGDRSQYEVTVKMFYLTVPGSTAPLSTEQLTVAIQDLETALGVSEIKIDHFVLSLPHQSFDENGLDETEVVNFSKSVQDSVLPVWRKLSELRQSGRIGRLGVAEFGKQELEILKTAADAQGLSVPEINQVNLQDCCVLPKDLINYSKEQKIELLTHGDATEILPTATFSSILRPYLPATAATTLAPNFVLKYSAFITSRGLITKKGYIVDASV